MHKEKPLIEIRPSAIADGDNEFMFSCMAADFNDPKLAEAGFSREVKVRVTATRSADEIDVTIETEAEADFTCDICLTPLQRVLKGKYRLYFGWGEPEETEDDEEYRILDRNASSIDLTEDVRETLLLSRPMKVTCTDNPECQVYTGSPEKDIAPEEEQSSWKESLEKLKEKYR